MIRKKRKKEKFLKQLLTTIFGTALLAAVAALIVLKVFVVKTVKVEGNKLYEESRIIEAVLNDEYTWNSLYVLLKYTFQDTESIPFIDEMEISLNDPQTLTIKVYEKGLLGYLYISAIGENAYFDKDGLVVETSSRIIENVPLIEGVVCDTVVLYEKLPIDKQDLKQMLFLTQSLKREELEPDSIQYGVKDAPILRYGEVYVTLGSNELLTQKVARLGVILPKLEGMAGTLHLSNWSEETTDIMFEKAPEEEETSTEEGAEGESETTESETETSENVENEEIEVTPEQ